MSWSCCHDLVVRAPVDPIISPILAPPLRLVDCCLDDPLPPCSCQPEHCHARRHTFVVVVVVIITPRPLHPPVDPIIALWFLWQKMRLSLSTAMVWFVLVM
jgi:hypothetical protein